jgi:hypothetical protein
MPGESVVNRFFEVSEDVQLLMSLALGSSAQKRVEPQCLSVMGCPLIDG